MKNEESAMDALRRAGSIFTVGAVLEHKAQRQRTCESDYEGLVQLIGTVTDDHGETGTDYYRVPFKDKDGEDINIEHCLEHVFPNKGCHCSHDCCGHRFYSSGDVVGKDEIHEHFLISQGWGINI
jgi:hypothetical protein